MLAANETGMLLSSKKNGEEEAVDPSLVMECVILVWRFGQESIFGICSRFFADPPRLVSQGEEAIYRGRMPVKRAS